MFLTISLLILLFANLYYAGEKNVLLVFFCWKQVIPGFGMRMGMQRGNAIIPI